MQILIYFVIIAAHFTISSSVTAAVNQHQHQDSVKFLNSEKHGNATHAKSATKSLSHYARVKLASLQDLRNQLVRHQQLQQRAAAAVVVGKATTTFQSNNMAKVVEPKEAASSSLGDDARNNFWSSIIPKTDILQKLARMRKKLEPSLRTYLTTKYNDFLTNLVEYSDNIGVPPFVLNSMKIPQNFDPRWSVIEKLLETSSLERFLSSLPELSSLIKMNPRLTTTNPDNGDEDVMRGRNDDDFISDQEPQATSKGKKKYGGLRLANRVKVYRKGDDYGPQRTGYEYGAAGDQYGLYSHSSYDTSYGKGYDDYYSTKPTGGGSDKSYGDYSKNSGMKGLVGKYAGLGFSSGGFVDNYGAAGHNSYSYGGGGHGGGGGGGGGGGVGNYLDPFSILGGLAFLVYLGLLFQQSLNRTGRAMPDSIFDSSPWKKPIVLTQLSFNEDFNQVEHARHGRSADLHDLEEPAVQNLENFWNDVEGLRKIENLYCRRHETCHVIKELHSSGFLNLFLDQLEANEIDRPFVANIYNMLEKEGREFECGNDYQCDLENRKILYGNKIIGND